MVNWETWFRVSQLVQPKNWKPLHTIYQNKTIIYYILVTCNIMYQHQYKLQYINYSHNDSNLLKWCHCVYIYILRNFTHLLTDCSNAGYRDIT